MSSHSYDDPTDEELDSQQRMDISCELGGPTSAYDNAFTVAMTKMKTRLSSHATKLASSPPTCSHACTPCTGMTDPPSIVFSQRRPTKALTRPCKVRPHAQRAVEKRRLLRCQAISVWLVHYSKTWILSLRSSLSETQMMKLSRPLLSRKLSSQTLLSGKWFDVRIALCSHAFESRTASSTTVYDFVAKGHSNPRVFAHYTVSKGKVQLSVSFFFSACMTACKVFLFFQLTSAVHPSPNIGFSFPSSTVCF